MLGTPFFAAINSTLVDVVEGSAAAGLVVQGGSSVELEDPEGEYKASVGSVIREQPEASALPSRIRPDAEPGELHGGSQSTKESDAGQVEHSGDVLTLPSGGECLRRSGAGVAEGGQEVVTDVLNNLLCLLCGFGGVSAS